MARTTDLLDEAQAIEAGYAALAFLAEDLARLTRFLDLTGLSPDQLRSQADDRRQSDRKRPGKSV